MYVAEKSPWYTDSVNDILTLLALIEHETEPLYKRNITVI